MSADSLLRTPLYDRHVALGARMVPFSGWEMPLQYSGTLAEHRAVRSQVGVFDISHMGKFLLRGAQVRSQLERLVPSSLADLEKGQGRYTVLLNERGGIVDDLIFYCGGGDPERAGWEVWAVIVNAATTQKDKDWLLQHLEEVELRDRSAEQSLLAIQGPEAEAAFQPLVRDDLGAIARFGHATVALKNSEDFAFVARTGYTGEDGFEVMLPIAAGVQLWDRLLDAGVTPCGLGSRDTLRLEASLHLYGQDMDDDTTPLEASLGWLVHWKRKGEFIGRSVLERQKAEGLPRKLAWVTMDGREIARPGYDVMVDGSTVGTVVSGTKSPMLGKGIAIAYLPPALAKSGTKIEIAIRGKHCPATVVKRPFYPQ
ncbi:glycine cleavage system aminomethyltransferase GcvT [Synechococcus sp. PCC 7336]|uniref:glycine cleavage system aminomethyltransferase GcvT n=1 Tax=Synechococcus sp. PCC 7336 TaxID=195250 RepID=UPI00034B1A85|nr:glycine cleavage system aminomethyltransferase GcvT [Synechococcus sp. PCC 7336]